MLVRGKFPYVVMVDDIKKDDKEHLYEWLMMLPAEIGVEQIDIDKVILFDETHENVQKNEGIQRQMGNDVPRCLIQILDRVLPDDKFRTPETRFELIQLKDARSIPKPGPKTLQKRLVIPSRAVEPKFKMLLYPHYKGAKLPTIAWNDKRDKVTVTFPGQVDEITFTPDSKGRNKVSVVRDGKKLGEL